MEKGIVNERTVPEVGLLIMLLIILYALTACGEHSRRYYVGYDVYSEGKESKEYKGKPGN